ncbi:MAG: hypothetical protein IPF43_00235 [Arcobacter sp.]|nr:hypothetical protein [Arcobacter sp.]
MIDIKEELIKEIKELLKTDENENIDINPNYLNYFDEDELKDIVFRLIEKKVEQKEEIRLIWMRFIKKQRKMIYNLKLRFKNE